jgi:hypothetical protein
LSSITDSVLKKFCTDLVDGSFRISTFLAPSHNGQSGRATGIAGIPTETAFRAILMSDVNNGPGLQIKAVRERNAIVAVIAFPGGVNVKGFKCLKDQ